MLSVLPLKVLTFFFVLLTAFCEIAQSQQQVATAQRSPESLAYILQADKFAKSKEDAVNALAGCGRQWLVIDASFYGDDASRWTRQEIGRIRNGLSDRRVIAYLSIGEAEDYRSYWKPEWDRKRPPFMLGENPDWQDNYGVKYWMNAWRQIIFAEIDKAMTQGFDGLYLDKVDMFEFFEFDPGTKTYIDNRPNPITGNTYREDMIAWVRAVSERARRANPSALIIPQNGEQLLVSEPYRNISNGIGIESLYTKKVKGTKKYVEQSTAAVKYREGFIKRLTTEGKPVLCVDYSTTKPLQRFVRQAVMQRPYVLLITDEKLTTLGSSP